MKDKLSVKFYTGNRTINNIRKFLYNHLDTDNIEFIRMLDRGRLNINNRPNRTEFLKTYFTMMKKYENEKDFLTNLETIKDCGLDSFGSQQQIQILNSIQAHLDILKKYV